MPISHYSTNGFLFPAPPKVGRDEEKIAIVNDHVTLNCGVEEEGFKPSISWLVVSIFLFLFF